MIDTCIVLLHCGRDKYLRRSPVIILCSVVCNDNECISRHERETSVQVRGFRLELGIFWMPRSAVDRRFCLACVGSHVESLSLPYCDTFAIQPIGTDMPTPSANKTTMIKLYCCKPSKKKFSKTAGPSQTARHERTSAKTHHKLHSHGPPSLQPTLS